MKLYGILGILLLLVGSSMLVGVWSPIAQGTIIYNTPPDIWSPFPSGTETSPTPLAVNTQIWVSFVIGEPEGVKSWAINVYMKSGGTWTYIQLIPSTALAPPDAYGTASYRSVSQWTPVASQSLYKFIFDATNVVDQTTTVMTYGSTALAPLGKFYVNDQESTTTNTIKVTTATLNIRYECSANGNIIQSIHVHLYNFPTGSVSDIKPSDLLNTVTLTETTTDTKWTGTLTLPKDGRYYLQGDITDGLSWWTQMSMVANMGPSSLTTNQIVGALLDMVGLLFLAIDRKIIKV